jgi:hypothetical protein
MKTASLFPLGALGAVMLLCSPAPHEKSESVQAGVDATNARIWIAPLVNNSDIASIEGWPADSLQRTVLMRHFNKIQVRLLSEMRRCEKYGLYTMVDNQKAATMTVSITLMPFTRSYDTVTIPVRVRVVSSESEAVPDFEFKPRCPAFRELKNSNTYHYVGLILSNYVDDFPYNDIARIFYAAEKKKSAETKR